MIWPIISSSLVSWIVINKVILLCIESYVDPLSSDLIMRFMSVLMRALLYPSAAHLRRPFQMHFIMRPSLWIAFSCMHTMSCPRLVLISRSRLHIEPTRKDSLNVPCVLLNVRFWQLGLCVGVPLHSHLCRALENFWSWPTKAHAIMICSSSIDGGVSTHTQSCQRGIQAELAEMRKGSERISKREARQASKHN